MTPYSSAQGLASLGRNNDSMLVHMTPNEVQGLQSLAMSHGGSLTINPQTGLPEAGFLDAILPTVAGLGLNAMFPGLGALGSGLLVGGVTALATGDITKGLMAGMGAGAGAGLGNTFAEMGKGAVGGITGPEAIGAVQNSVVQQLPSSVAQNAATNMGMFNAPGATATLGGASASVPTATQMASTIGDTTSNLGMFNTGATGATSALAPSASQIASSTASEPLSLMDKAGGRLGQMGEGFKQFASDPFDKGYDAFKAAGGKGMDLASPVMALGMEALKPEPYAGYEDPDKGKYRGPQGQLNLSDRFDTGLRLAVGGTVSSSIQGGGVRDLYGATDNQQLGNLSTDGYGLGRLNSLGAEQSMQQAQTYGYAGGGLTALKQGGYLNGDGDGMSDSIPATIEGKQPARLADGEFVVPADVVSHLGNGSSKAGSKRLYAMLDKVRHARTGNKKQGKEINPAKYMPA